MTLQSLCFAYKGNNGNAFFKGLINCDSHAKLLLLKEVKYELFGKVSYVEQATP